MVIAGIIIAILLLIRVRNNFLTERLRPAGAVDSVSEHLGDFKNVQAGPISFRIPLRDELQKQPDLEDSMLNLVFEKNNLWSFLDEYTNIYVICCDMKLRDSRTRFDIKKVMKGGLEDWRKPYELNEISSKYFEKNGKVFLEGYYENAYSKRRALICGWYKNPKASMVLTFSPINQQTIQDSIIKSLRFE